MYVTNLDGDMVSWNLTGHIAKGRISNKSSYHIEARKLLTSIFPTLQILEEVSIPIKRGETLYLDFYLPLIKVAVEVHGEQHYKYVPYYHGSPMGFLKAQKNDKQKKEWCEINNIKLVELPYNETTDKWKLKIKYE